MKHDLSIHIGDVIGSILFVGDLRMEQATMKAGDLIRFTFIHNGCDLNMKTALYLGKNFLTRDDNSVIQNHKVMVTGDSTPTIIDRGLLKYMEVIK